MVGPLVCGARVQQYHRGNEEKEILQKTIQNFEKYIKKLPYVHQSDLIIWIKLDKQLKINPKHSCCAPFLHKDK